jgi:hypothetical protein
VRKLSVVLSILASRPFDGVSILCMRFRGTESGWSNRDESIRMNAGVPGVLLLDHERY